MRLLRWLNTEWNLFTGWVRTRHYFRDRRFWAVVILLVAAIWGNYQAWQAGNEAQSTQAQFEKETAGRRDEACRGYELGHKQEITDLERSYDLFLNPTPAIKPYIDAFVNDPRVLAQLGEEIRNAQNDQDSYGEYVPSYCDEKGFGLKEPDPLVPVTPPALEKAIAKLQKAATS